jgi:hypothetical protein
LPNDPEPRVVVLKSGDPDFFVTHDEFSNLSAIQLYQVPTSIDEVELKMIRIVAYPQIQPALTH